MSRFRPPCARALSRPFVKHGRRHAHARLSHVGHVVRVQHGHCMVTSAVIGTKRKDDSRRRRVAVRDRPWCLQEVVACE